jgi:hypothetical protein
MATPDYISAAERAYWLQARAGFGADGLLDQVVFFLVAHTNDIRTAKDLVDIKAAVQAAHLWTQLRGNWNGEEFALQESLRRLETDGLVEIRDGLYHVKNREGTSD